MGQIKIVSDGTLAGTVVTEVSTGEKITGIRGMEFGVEKLPDGAKVLIVKLTIRRPILEIEGIQGTFGVE